MTFRKLNITLISAAVMVVGTLDAFAGKSRSKHVEAEYTYTVPSHQSDDDARLTAIQRARTQAIIEAFGGEEISQINSTLINAGGDTGDAVSFQSHMQSKVRGVWVCDTKEPKFRYAQDPVTGMRVITVTVCGEAYPLNRRKFPCKVEPMRLANNKLSATDRFISGDVLVINFQAPSDGYCAVYLVDENNCVTRALPNQHGAGSLRVVADRQYQLLHPELSPADGGCQGLYDNYEFYTEGKQVINWLCIAFSSKELQRPPDSVAEGVTGEGTMTPSGTDLNTFNRWAVESEDYDDSFTMLRIPVFIFPN